MATSTLLTLLVIPAIYGLVKGWGLQRRPIPVAAEASY
jgi:copper/silver efflux system protein